MPRDIEKRLSWANSAAAGTTQEAVGQDAGHTAGESVVLIHNPSAVTALTVRCLLRWRDTAGVDRYGELTTFSVPANSTEAVLVDGLGLGVPVIRASNDTALGVADGFDAELRVEFVGA